MCRNRNQTFANYISVLDDKKHPRRVCIDEVLSAVSSDVSDTQHLSFSLIETIGPVVLYCPKYQSSLMNALFLGDTQAIAVPFVQFNITSFFLQVFFKP